MTFRFVRKHFLRRKALVDLRTRFGIKGKIKEIRTYRNETCQQILGKVEGKNIESYICLIR